MPLERVVRDPKRFRPSNATIHLTFTDAKIDLPWKEKAQYLVFGRFLRHKKMTEGTEPLESQDLQKK